MMTAPATATARIELAGPEPLSELLAWHLCTDTMPDAELTVLMWHTDDIGPDWSTGWWDGADWRYAETGGEVCGTVTHWAEPCGPQP